MSKQPIKQSILIFASITGVLTPNLTLAQGNPLWWANYQQDSTPTPLMPVNSKQNSNLAGPAVLTMSPLSPLQTMPLPTTDTKPPGNQNPNQNQNGNQKPNPGQQQGNITMKAADVPDEYSCPLFENRPHEELIGAIDSMIKEVQITPECKDQPATKAIDENGKVLIDSAEFLKNVSNNTDPASVDVRQVDQVVSAAVSAIGNLGSVVNNSSFLNSKCGKEAMSTGKMLLGLNDVINGFAPYALMAVSMNAALAPALPFVIGGVVATSGISAISKMIDKNGLDMGIPEHRKALLQNTCQYTKVAQKVRFMQLAQSGQIETITNELQKNIDLYKAKFDKPTGALNQILTQRSEKLQETKSVENQYTSDLADLRAIEEQLTQSSQGGQGNDDLFICTFGKELSKWAEDGKSFPASVFTNLESAAQGTEKGKKLQAVALIAMSQASIDQVKEFANGGRMSEQSMRACAKAGKSLISVIRQGITLTFDIIRTSRSDLDAQFSENPEFVQWQKQTAALQTEKLTISRVQKAMEDLQKDTSIIDRSELAQRMVILKAGLFGSHSAWFGGQSPVYAWIAHTQKMHQQAVAAMKYSLSVLVDGAYSLTPAAKGEAVKFTSDGQMYIDSRIELESYDSAQTLNPLTLANLPLGTRENEMACQQLESAWLDWTAALDHIGAIQFFCDMIDPVLDVKMDASVIRACRGDHQLSGKDGYYKSAAEEARAILVKRGFKQNAELIRSKLSELQCPKPPVSVMNN